MEDFLRLPGTTRRDPAIDAWLAARAGELREIASHWFETMRGCGDDVREIVHDGAPTACVGDVPFGYVNVFRAHVNVGFFNGARLSDPTGLLLGDGKRMRHVKLVPGAVVDEEALGRLIAESHAEIRRRVSVVESIVGPRAAESLDHV